MSNIKIGLFGFGVVGEGIYRVLKQKPQLNATISKICIKNGHIQRNALQELFTTNKEDILLDNSIDVVVELIDDAEAAYEIVKKALKAGKHVVTANKKMVAAHLPELIDLQRKHKRSLLYEGAVCGSIPVIRNLEEYFDNDLLNSVTGIVNGSTNYILSQMANSGTTFTDALLNAQESGYAESNPSLDVKGYDAANKLSIIICHAFGKFFPPENIITKGIDGLTPFDFAYAQEKNKVIKLVASVNFTNQNNCQISVLPSFISNRHRLAQVNDVYNGLLIGSTLADQQFFSGKGAGRYPTSSAILSDISALHYNYKYEYKKLTDKSWATNTALETVFISYPRQYNLDKDLFTVIREQFSGATRNYIIADVSFTALNTSTLFEEPAVSIVHIPKSDLSVLDTEQLTSQNESTVCAN